MNKSVIARAIFSGAAISFVSSATDRFIVNLHHAELNLICPSCSSSPSFRGGQFEQFAQSTIVHTAIRGGTLHCEGFA
jgi:hypothetical protein